MSGAQPAGRRRPRRSGAIAASVAIHALLLALVLWSARPPPPEPAQPRDVQVALAPLPRAQARAAPRAAASPQRSTLAARAPRPTPAPRPQPAARLPAPPAPPATGRLPSVGAAAPSGAGSAPHPGPLPSAEASGDVRGLLRATVGCEHRDAVALTPAERERCDARLGALARATPPVDLMPPDKRGVYGASADAAARRRALRDDPLYRPVVACQGAGSNLGLGCLPDDAIHHVGAH